MFPILLLLGFAASSTISGAANIPLARNPVKKFTVTPLNSNSAGSINSLSNVQNVRYATNIIVNGVELFVALDTGSTDLWVQAPRGLGKFNDTNIPLTLSYGDGTAKVEGTIGVAPVEVGPYKVDHQAFLNADNVTFENLGLNGLFGLGFDQIFASPINNATETIFGSSATLGASFLNNTFSQNPQQPNFVAFDLSRSGDLESSGDGSFTIGEYDPDYSAVARSPRLPKYPPPPIGYRWSTIFDAIQVNGTAVSVSSGVKGVPKGKGVALLDTGNPSASVPENVLDAIYSTVEGAVKYTESRVDSWIIPCTSTSLPTLSFVFGEQELPIHPLDLSDISVVQIGQMNYTVCSSSFQHDDTIIAQEFDIALGDTFLRNVYSVYDFGDRSPNGDVIGDAYIQLLSKTDITKANTDYTSSRANALKQFTDPEIPPAQLLKLLSDNDSSDDCSNGSTNDKAKTRLAEPSETNSNLVAKYGPAVIGLLAANVLIGLILFVLVVLQYIRRGALSNYGTTNPRYIPVGNKFEEGGNVSGHY